MSRILFILVSMAVTGDIVFFLLLLMQNKFMKTKSAKWHYRTMKWCMLFYVIPLPVITRIRFNFKQDIKTILFYSEENIALSKLELETIVPVARYLLYFLLLLLFLIAIYLTIRFILNYRKHILIISLLGAEADDPDILDLFFKAKQQLGIKRNITLYFADYTGSPFSTGFFRQNVILTNIDLDTERLQMVFMHELCHCKQRDMLIKGCSVILQMVYWFNPIIYLYSKQLANWSELACDETVTASYDKKQRITYASMLLELLEKSKGSHNNFTNSFSNTAANLESRVKRIVNHDWQKVGRTLSTVMILIILIIGFSTSLLMNYLFDMLNKNVTQKALDYKNMEITSNSNNSTDSSIIYDSLDWSDITVKPYKIQDGVIISWKIPAGKSYVSTTLPDNYKNKVLLLRISRLPSEGTIKCGFSSSDGENITSEVIQGTTVLKVGPLTGEKNNFYIKNETNKEIQFIISIDIIKEKE